MKKLVALVTPLTFYITALSQSISINTINSGGKSAETIVLHLEYAIGDAITGETTNSSMIYTAGFIQPYMGIAASVPFVNNVNLSSGSGIDNAGSYFQTQQMNLEFTLGEFASTSLQQNNHLLTQGILQPYIQLSNSPLPVTGLEFFVKRLNTRQVQLDWRTVQEIHNKGFYIERKKENENSFLPLRFVNSKAPGGNSSLPLTYIETDQNSFVGKTYYRLKQEDIDGKTSYSVIKVVNGEAGSIEVLKAWPVPAAGEFSVTASGIDHDELLIHDLNGKLVRQMRIAENEVIKIRLSPGVYFIRLKSRDLVQKIVIQ